MKKLYLNFKLFSLVALLFFMSGFANGQIFITELADPNNDAGARYVELYNAGASSFDFAANNYALLRYTNGNTGPQSAVALTGTIPAGGFYVISNNGSNYTTVYGLTADQDIGTGGAADSNGDDQILLIDNTDNLNPITIDIFGVIGEDGSGTGHEFEDGRAERKLTVTSGNATWDVNEWNVDNDSGGGNGIQNAPVDFDPASWIGVGACTPPTTQATAGVPSVNSDTQITMNWTRGNGTAGVVVLAKEGSAVDANPASGTAYTADAAFGAGDEIGTGNFVVYVGTGITVPVTSLNLGTTYHFAVYEYNTVDNCYLTPAATASETTTTSFDGDSDIVGPTTQVAAGDVSSVANDMAAAVGVFTFKLTDVGTSDATATSVQTIVIEKGANNTVSDWSSIIAGAKLNDGADVTVTGTTINPDNITFDLTGNEYSIADNTSKELTLSIWLANSVTDQEILEFEIPTAHNFTALTNGTTIKPTLGAAVTSNMQTIEVVATQYSPESKSAFVVNKSFTLTITAVDANGNTDIAARSNTLSLASGTGNLTSVVGLAAQPMVDGFFQWTDLTYDKVESIDLTLNDDGSALTISTPSPIPVLGNLFYTEEFDYANGVTLNSTANWERHSGATDQMLVVTPGLTYSAYPNSGTGNAVQVVEGGSEDLSSGEVDLYEGSVYISALVNVSGTTKPDAFGEYFLHTRQASGSFGNRIYVKDEGGILRFGLTKSSGSVEYLTGDYNYDQTYLLVIKYTFNTGASNDDVMDLWVDPSIGGSESAPTYTHSATINDVASIAQISVRQSGGTGNIIVDGIRSSTTWEDLLPANCTVPTTQASAVTFGATDANSMVINWTAGNGDKSLVVVKEAGAVDVDPILGVDYTTATTVFSDAIMDIGSGNIVVYAGNNATQTVTVTGLTQGTVYHVAVYEYNGVDFCYNITSPAVGNTTTTTLNDTDSDISAPTTQIMAGTISSVANDMAAAVNVFSFKLTDAGTIDGVSTFVQSITIEKGTNNTVVDWSAIIGGAKLNDGADLTVTGTTIGADNITFDLTGNEYEVADNTSKELTLSIWLNTSVTDEEAFEFEIPTTHGFTTLASGSSLLTTLVSAVTSNLQIIDVDATVFNISAPASASPVADFTITATAVDANGNTDIAARNVTLSRNAGAGTLSSVTGLGPVAMTAGVYTWADAQHDTEESITVDVTDGSITTTSANIGISSIVSSIEDFTNFPETGSSYVDGSFVGNDGSTWTYLQSRGDQVIDGATPMLGRNRSPAAEMTSGTISGGISTLNFDYMQAFSTAVNLEVYVNNVLVATVTTNNESGVIKNSGDIAVDIAGDFMLSFKQPSGSGQVNIDNVAWSAFNASAPVISTTTTSFNGDFGIATESTVSASSSFTVEGSLLTADIEIAAPAGFAVSLDDATFASSVTLTQAGGLVNATTVYARFEPVAVQAYVGNITLTSAGANDKLIAVSGTGIGASTIFYEDFATCPSSTMVTFSAASDRDWDCTASGNSGNAALISGFGGDVASDDWLITPAIDLSAATNATLTFASWTRYTDVMYPPVALMASTDYSGSGDPSSATWTALSALFSGEDSQTWTSSGDIDLQSYVGGSVYIAFQYTSSGIDGGQTANWAIDDILVEDRVGVANPSFTLTASLTDFGTVDNGNTSTSQSFTVEGSDLAGDIMVTAPSNFEVSSDDATFSASILIAPNAGSVASTDVFVRFKPASGLNGVVSGDITVSTTNALDQTIVVTGTEAGNQEITGDLFISEYIEGTGNNRAIEIYNGTGAAVDLSNYTLKQSHNGVGFGNDPVADVYDLPLSGTLADGDVFIVYNADADTVALIDQGDMPLTYADTGNGVRVAAFTGDDAIGLFKNGVIIDLIGDPNNRPATGWDVAGVSPGTVNHILVRKSSIATGNITPLGSFGTTASNSEWIVQGEKDYSSTGSHAVTVVEDGFALNTDNFNGDFADTNVGEVSDASSYTVSGKSITGDFTITIPVGFEASLTADFSNKVGDSDLPLSITPTSGEITDVTVYVRFKPSTVGDLAGNLVNSATGYPDVMVAVTGKAIEEQVLGIKDIEDYNIAVYPNPAVNKLYITIPDAFGTGTIRLLSLDGAVLKMGNIGSIDQFDLTDVSSGIYLVQIRNKNTVISHRVLVK